MKLKVFKLLAFIPLLFGLIPLTSCSSSNTITVSEVTHSIFYAPLYVALNKGYFEEEGINVEIVTTPGADKVMASLLSKDAQIGLMGISLKRWENIKKTIEINP